MLGMSAKEAKKAVQQKKDEMTMELVNGHHCVLEQIEDSVKDMPTAKQKRDLQNHLDVPR